MKTRNIYTAIAVFCFSPAVMAAGAGRVDARQYVRTYDCSFAQVSAAGSACENEDTCPNLSLVYSETISLVTKDKTTELEPLATQFPASRSVDTRRVYALSAVRCHTNSEISILYWGGGNCRSGCEAAVRYKLSPAGALIEKKIIEGRWSASPAVKEYSSFEKQQHTKWLDAK
jgi:hypothetical protein